MLYKYLFPRYCNEPIASVILLLLRLFFGLLIMMHGLEKLNSFSTLSLAFPDVLGMGSKTSLLLTIFAEVVCAAAFVLAMIALRCRWIRKLRWLYWPCTVGFIGLVGVVAVVIHIIPLLFAAVPA